MSGVGGIDGLHSVSGRCDLCGETCDSETQELNALSCTFAPNCPEEASLYHQDCLEKYLKNIRCEKNRKTGFKCPRGCGKGTKYDEPCRGKIDKSHPIHVRNDNNKKRKKAKMPEAPPEPPRFGPAAKAARAKEREEEKTKKKAAANAAAKTAATVAPKAKATAAKKESLASAAAAARRELGLLNGGSATAAVAKVAPAAPAVRSYEEHLAARSTRLGQSTACTPQATPAVKSVWGASPAQKLPAPSPLAVSSSEAFPAVSASLKPLPTPQPNGSWASNSKRLAAASSESDGSSSRQSQSTSVAGRSAASAAAAAAAPAPTAEVPKLSKAFRKNMRRAERKREKEIENSVTSEPSPPLTPHQKPGLAAAQSPVASPTKSSSAASVQLSPGSSKSAAPAAAAAATPLRPPDLQLDSDIVEHCLQLVAMHKMRQASLQLQFLGFVEWQAAAAVHAKGCSLHTAVAWLLEGGVASKAEAQRLLQQSAPPTMDVTEEAQQLEAAARRMGLPQAALCREVIRRNGDLLAVLSALPQPLQQPQLSMPPPQPQQGYQLQLPPLSQPQGSSARQRHQRTFSPLVSTASLAQPKVPGSEPLSSASGAEAAGDSLNPLLDAVLPRDIVGSAAAAPHRTIVQQSRSGGSSASLGLGSIGHSNTASNTHSRVSSFDMLSVGNPWGDLLPANSGAPLDQQQSSASKAPGPEGRNGFGHTVQQLPSPFNVSQLADLSPGPSPVGRRSFGHHHTHSSSFFGSPTLQAVASGAGLDHYASALSSQPSWASTSSNLWGAPGPMAGDHSGLRHQQQQQQQQPQSGVQQQQQSMADVPAAALLAAAAVASDGGEEVPAAGLSLGDSELNALMATLMCR